MAAELYLICETDTQLPDSVVLLTYTQQEQVGRLQSYISRKSQIKLWIAENGVHEFFPKLKELGVKLFFEKCKA
jgi:hypothetical protein